VGPRCANNLAAYQFDDLKQSIEDGNGTFVLRCIDRLKGFAALLDVLGWTEHDGTPDRQAIRLTPEAVAWARIEASGLHGSLPDIEAEDVQLDADRTLCAIAGGS